MQTLWLLLCFSLQTLPASMKSLVALKSLDLSCCGKLAQLPDLSDLPSLEVVCADAPLAARWVAGGLTAIRTS